MKTSHTVNHGDDANHRSVSKYYIALLAKCESSNNDIHFIGFSCRCMQKHPDL